MKKLRIVANMLLIMLCFAIFPFGVYAANSLMSSQIQGSITINGLLPDTYTALEYIESTGSEYIDTGITVNQNTSIELYGNLLTGNNSIFGANPYFVITSINSKYRFRYNNSVKDSNINSNTLAKLYLNKNYAYIDDVLIGTFNEGTFSSEQNAYLFCRSASDGTVEEVSSSRIYSAKIWDNNVLVRNFIPCLNENGTAGMYDAINKKFYDNDGSGVFIYSTSLPNEYTRVSYLESSGTQYIDTGLKMNQNYSVDIYAKFVTTSETSVFGANPHFVITSKSSKYRFRYNNTIVDTTYSITDTSLVSLRKNVIYVNNIAVDAFTVSTFTSSYNAFLFGRSSSSGSAEELSSLIMYFAKIWDGDKLVRHFIPCIKDDSAGLYDIVNGIFYDNDGTGVFNFA